MRHVIRVFCAVLSAQTIFPFSIPIQSIATNGPSLVGGDDLLHAPFWSRRSRWMICVRCTDLGGPRASGQQVHKVRFVASTLLDAVRKAETAPASAARAHAYLCELLVLPPYSFLLLPRLPFRLLLSLRLPFPLAPPPSDARSSPFVFGFVFPHSESRAGFRVLPPYGLANTSVCLFFAQGTSCPSCRRSNATTCESPGGFFSSAREADSRHYRLDDDRDGASNDNGMPLMAN